MQPLYCFTASSPAIGPGVMQMAQLMNYAMKDRPFKLLQTVIVPEITTVNTMTNSITMIFEAESAKAIAELGAWMQHDEDWKRMTEAPHIRLIK